ncbi:hypothetical protein TNCT_249311 [Trichonephila clavata]|uniref:Uncharacterized protein n=1 Tax=Trichonephila clavata TaxID=2740835 RepID=A0A8X6HP88_TRICU|nr:hypothetical protein TNCT_249311 [Trichonephila clavata]
MPRSFLVKKAKYPVDHGNRWNYRDHSGPTEGATAPPCSMSPTHRCLTVHYTNGKLDSIVIVWGYADVDGS